MQQIKRVSNRSKNFFAVLLCIGISSFGFSQISNSNTIQLPSSYNVPGTCDGNCPSSNNNTKGGNNQVQDGNQSLGQTVNLSKCGLNYTQASVRLGKRGSLNGANQPATFTISGMPNNACIELAYVYSSMSGTAIAHNVTITNPNTVTNNYPMQLIGSAADKCWGYGGTTSYRGDVTAAITGNGNYQISGLPVFPTPQKDTDGATLFIIYSDPAATYEGHIVMHDGCQVGIGGFQASTITGINACDNATLTRGFVMVGDLQLGAPQANMNGGVIPMTPWNWWNYNEANIPLITNGQATAAANMNLGGDCYNWVVSGLYYQTTTCTTCPQTGLNLTTTVTDALCGQCDGTATVNVTGGTPPYTYQWSNGGTTQTVTGLCAGTYTVTVMDDGACPLVATTTVTIVSTTGITLTDSQVNVLCNGDCNGTATSVPSGGTPPYTYLWSNAQTTQTSTGLCAGTYTVTVTDNDNCTATSTFTITEPPLLTANITAQTNVLCNGDNTGSATVTAGGGTPGYTYNWSSGGNAATENGLGAGAYTVTVTDANGCTAVANVTITEPPVLTVNITLNNNVSCNGGNDGSATANAGGGTPGYTYAWSNGGNTQTENNLTAGTHTVTVTDANGCTATATVNVTEPPALSVSITNQTNLLCNGDNNGSATAAAAGGTPGYSYAWSSGGNTSVENGLAAGTYTVTVTDNNGCTATATVTITEPPVLTANITAQTNVLCNGGNTGSATVTAGGGTPGYTYAWSSGGTAATENNLAAGAYTVTVTDNNGCTAVANVNITEPPAMNLNFNTVNSNCGQNDGSASVAVAGGTSPYTYAWSNGPTTPNNPNISAGTYTVTVTDDNGCTVVGQAVVNDNGGGVAAAAITSNYNGEDISCNGACDGAATSSMTGGTAPFTYLWSNGPVTQAINGLCAGTYTVTITDDVGCSSVASVTLTEPTVVTATINNSTNVDCNGGNNGTASVTAGGGTPNYTYAWSSGGNTANETGLAAGTHTVTITDVNGCTATTTVVITEPTALTAVTSVTSNYNGEDVSCFGSTDGSADVTASGGTLGYSYAWSSGGNTSTENGLGAGTYTVTVTDANGCTVVETVTLTEPTQITATITGSNDASCFGYNDGDATVLAGGGTPTYTYAWSSGGTNANETGLGAGTYTVTVTDVNGCTATDVVTINHPPGLSTTTNVTSNYNGQDVSCNGSTDGSADIVVNGGTSPYSYNWSSGSTTTTDNNLGAGTYYITVTDGNGCTLLDSVTLTEPTVVTAAINNSTDVSCNGGADGTATATAGGGTPGYTYNWSSGGNTANETGLAAGTYTVTITDNNGCTATAQIVIGEPTPLTTTTTITSNYNGEDVSCFGSNDGIAATNPIGGTSPYTFFWSNGGNTDTTNGLSAQTYYVTITDDNGCTVVDSVTLTEPTQVNLSVTAQNDARCFGEANGDATVSANGGTPGYTYNWSSGGNTALETNLAAGNYTVTVTDANGCEQTVNVTISQPNELLADITPVHVNCQGECDGVADLVVSGGTTPYSYLWNTAATTEDLLNICPESYSVEVTDAKGCVAIANTVIDVLYPNPIADFYADPERTTVLDTEIDFYDVSIANISAWNWTFYAQDSANILGTSIEQNPTFLYPEDTGSFPVRLEVWNEGNCYDDTTIRVIIDGVFNIFIPDAFSPNGDGINDKFFPKGVGVDKDNFTFYIFDRWGEIIFESHNWEDHWDGTARAKNGTEIVQEGVYVWQIVVQEGIRAGGNKGTKHEYVGHVTLIK